MKGPRIEDCLRAWADTGFRATAPESFLLHAAADLLEGTVWEQRDLVMTPPVDQAAPGPAPDPVKAHLSREMVHATDRLMMAGDPDAALDAEADALRVACGGIFSWDDIGKGAQNDWRAVALKAREMHRRKIGLEEAVAAYAEGDKHSLMFYTRHRDGIRALLARVGVEVTP